jgi:hypothetical protein
MIAVMMK